MTRKTTPKTRKPKKLTAKERRDREKAEFESHAAAWAIQVLVDADGEVFEMTGGYSESEKPDLRLVDVGLHAGCDLRFRSDGDPAENFINVVDDFANLLKAKVKLARKYAGKVPGIIAEWVAWNREENPDFDPLGWWPADHFRDWLREELADGRKF